ncbi:hypothetical protein BH11MYX1_BH11MYX1_21550 [soil metagenome]
MVRATERDDEAASQAALTRLAILDTAPETAFDALVRVAALVCGTPISLVTLIDRDRQWFKANLGLAEMAETPRDVAFCAHAVLGDLLFEIPDATKDLRFASNPLVTGDPNIRFYAGMPIRLDTGEHLGTICVIDREARVLTPEQREVLACLAEAAKQALEGRYARDALVVETRARKQREDALRRSEDFLARTNQLAGVGGWQIELPDQTVYWSDETCRIHGLAPGHVPELSTAIDFYLPHARPVIIAAVEMAIAGGPGWDLELPLRRVDGREVWVRTVGAAERENGQVVRLVGAFQDVTDRVNHLRAIERANERTAIATNSAEVGIWEFDLVTQTATWDAWMHRLHGLPAQSGSIGFETWASMLAPAALAAVRAELVAATRERRAFEVEFPVRWPDGTLHTLRSLAHVTRDAEGTAVGLVGANWDVTEPRRLAAQLALQAEIAVDANRAVTLSEVVLSVMDALRAHTGWLIAHVYLQSPDDPMVLVPTNVWSTSDREHYAAFMDETAATSLPIAAINGLLPSLAAPFSRARSAAQCGLGAGLEAPVLVGEEVVAAFEFYAAEASAFPRSFIDLVTYAGIQLGRVIDRERAEEHQAHALAEKTAMLQEIHHRVKNNLQMISSLLNLQARQILDPQAKAVFSEAQGRVHSISLLHEVLYQSGDLGRVDMRAYVTKLVTMLRRTHADVSNSAQIDAGIAQLFLPVDTAVPCGLIINELITNSLKHAFVASGPANAIAIDMHRSSTHVIVVVSDNGRGYADLGAATNTMGMMLVRDLAAQLRGTVTFENAGGARCSFQFPVHDER